jgi:hypothetical protein
VLNPFSLEYQPPRPYSTPFGHAGEGFAAGIQHGTFNPYISQATSSMSRVPTAPTPSTAEGCPIPPRDLPVVPRLIQAGLSPRTPSRTATPKRKQPWYPVTFVSHFAGFKCCFRVRVCLLYNKKKTKSFRKILLTESLTESRRASSGAPGGGKSSPAALVCQISITNEYQVMHYMYF